MKKNLKGTAADSLIWPLACSMGRIDDPWGLLSRHVLAQFPWLLAPIYLSADSALHLIPNQKHVP